MNRLKRKRANSSMTDLDDDQFLEQEVNRILGSLQIEDIRRNGIKKLPEGHYFKTQACFQIDVDRYCHDCEINSQ